MLAVREGRLWGLLSCWLLEVMHDMRGLFVIVGRIVD